VNDSTSLDYSTFSGATVTGWVQAQRLNHTDEQTLYGHWNGSSSKRPFQVLLTPTNQWQCNTNHNDGVVVSSSIASLDTWVHLACVWTPQGLTIYVDGTAEATDTTVQSSLDANEGKHTLGAREKSGALSQFFKGVLDEWRIYDQALTATDVLNLHNPSTQPPPS